MFSCEFTNEVAGGQALILWLTISLVSAFPWFPVYYLWVAKIRLDSKECLCCGYLTRGWTSSRCPECGSRRVLRKLNLYWFFIKYAKRIAAPFITVLLAATFGFGISSKSSIEGRQWDLSSSIYSPGVTVRWVKSASRFSSHRHISHILYPTSYRSLDVEYRLRSLGDYGLDIGLRDSTVVKIGLESEDVGRFDRFKGVEMNVETWGSILREYTGKSYFWLYFNLTEGRPIENPKGYRRLMHSGTSSPLLKNTHYRFYTTYKIAASILIVIALGFFSASRRPRA